MLTGARNPGADGRRGPRLRAEDGFTLIELMTTMLMLGIGMTAAFFFYSSAVARTTDTEERVQTIADLRNVGERIARDVRESEKICTPVPTAAASRLYLSGPPVPGVTSTDSDVCSTSRLIVWDCETTAGTCTRSEAGSTPVTQIADLSTTTPMFTASGSNYVSIYLAKVPEGRDAAITFERGASLRNYCIAGSGSLC